MDPKTSDIARHYDEVPYASKPFPQSQPQRLGALARLFGLNPPDISQSRVLELGCAAGGNLIPLASQFPDAEFLGLDLSPLQIASGQARIARMGLKNIRLVTQSIADVTRGLGQFDYIICHGVYSWVPAAVRDAILRVCGENLTGNGVAYVSYNVYPGWKLRGVLRDAMMFHGSTAELPSEQVALGRDFLNQLGEISNAGTPYGQMLRHEAKMMTGQEDYYVAHEYLEANNEPCYVSSFLKRLDIFNLAFLTEAEVHLTIAENFGCETGALLRSLSGNSLDRMEQYIDFLTGRTFRQSILVRKDQAHRVERTLSPDRLQGLNISTRVASVPESDAEGRFVFRDAAGRTLSTQSVAVREAVSHLAGISPATSTTETLVQHAASLGHGTEADVADVSRAIFNMVLAGIADISTEPVLANSEVAHKPKAHRLARFDAGDGSGWTTNARHETVPLNIIQRAVLPMLDGTHDQAALTRAVHDLVVSGDIVLYRNGEKLVDPDDISAAIEDHIASALQSFQAAALLAPAA
jgi:methyltransferase-like protein/cyclopropane fatty-acyl-phospholipid synthase-like methyltransferase